VFRETAPEVVVLDIVMDGMTGLEAAWRMREIAPDAKIVFQSLHNGVMRQEWLAYWPVRSFRSRKPAGS
jgi:CheY-like chemotaxis protein